MKLKIFPKTLQKNFFGLKRFGKESTASKFGCIKMNNFNKILISNQNFYCTESINPLQQKIEESLKDAMRKQEKERRMVIRNILSKVKKKKKKKIFLQKKKKKKKIHYAEIGKQKIDESGIIKVLLEMKAECEETVVEYEKYNRTDFIEKEKREIDVINTFLPPELKEVNIGNDFFFFLNYFF